ncbi:MAG: hypothetical protein Q8P11_02105 [bacterium]|nr:hypothetical protein [bacterium]
MTAMNFEIPNNPETEHFLQWVKDEIKVYEDNFELSHGDLNNKKILEIGAGDRRFAATCLLNGLTSEVYSLEPGLGNGEFDEAKPYATKEFLGGVLDKLPQDIQNKIEEKTIISDAEKISDSDGTYDLVIGRSVPFESEEQLEKRLHELLRVSKHVRLYPINESNRDAYTRAIEILTKDRQISVEYKTTVEDDIPTETGIKHITEDVVILRKTIFAD